jgi:hypothetical protein
MVLTLRSLLLLFFVAALCLAPTLLLAQAANEDDEDTVKTITAVRVNPGVSIDGVLDEEFWAKAPRSGNFTQYQPDEGSPATESTFVRVAFDDEALYVGMQMYDSEPDKIISRLTRRDRWVNGDLVHVIVDSYHDHQTAYAFTLYASGTQRDVYYYNDTWSDEDWDAVWDAATKITDWGWSAEYKIPFNCLRFACNGDPTWGIYFSRSIARKNELDRWLYIPESASGFVSEFGHLKGLKITNAPKRLEVRPYGVAYAETEEKSAGNPDGHDYFANTGFNLKYGITSNMTLDATINPDFGQVEADETILNLSAFETWYPEKRPFFLEGRKIFETYYSLYYSRRIGKPPSLWPDDADYYIDRPAATTILGAAKITGKTSGGTSIGIMESVTQREKARYADEAGEEHTATIEPEANHLVARLNQDILENSTVGVMATAVNQESRNPHYTGGADWNLRFRDGDFQIRGQVIGSRTEPERDGLGGVLMLEAGGHEHLRGSLRGEYRDRDLDLNRIGYLDRGDFKEAYAWLQFRTIDKWWIIRRTWNNLNLGYADNLSGVALTRGGNFNNSIELENFWSVGGGLWVDYDETYSDWETRGGPPVPIPLGQSWWAWLETDSRQWWLASINVGGGDTWDGRYESLSLWLELRPRSNIELSLGPNYRSDWGLSRWVATLEDEQGNPTDYIFGEQDMTRVDMTVRGTFTFSRDLSLQVYAQPFIAAVDYGNFKRLVGKGYEYVDSSVYDEAEEQPNFTMSSFNSNVVLRWEYMPGSTLFLVWTHARERTGEEGAFDFKRDWDGLFKKTATNTFLVKLSYWRSL